MNIIRNCPSAPLLEPSIVALQMMVSEAIKAPVEFDEVAKDVVKKIEEARQKKHEARATKAKNASDKKPTANKCDSPV